jgi:hypothetical protein
MNALPDMPAKVITFVREWRSGEGDDEDYAYAIAL